MKFTEIKEAVASSFRLLKMLFYFLGSLFIILLFVLPQGLDISAKAYDFRSSQTPIKARPDIDEVLGGFEKIPFEKLDDKKYLEWSQFDQKSFRSMAKGRHFYKISGKDYHKYLVGDFRVRDFLPKDGQSYTQKLLPGQFKQHYLMIDPRLLYKLAELQETLKSKNLNHEGFSLSSGFRHPRHNKKVGGASKSRHILGEAIDIRIGDINKDGKYTAEDKKIVYNLLDKKIIGNKGGLGRYPGTRIIHFDVRGKRARWDSY